MNNSTKNNTLSLIFIISVSLAIPTLLSGCASMLVAGTVAGAGATLASDRRSPAALLEDQAIEMRATDSIYGDKSLGKQVRVSVTSFNGLVLLTGEAPSQDLRLKATDIVRKLGSVREVYNEIQVGSPISLNDRSLDAWITGKAKAKLMANKGLFTRIKVVTSNSVVYLMGLATSGEREEATNLLSSIEGVDRVIALFEPISIGNSLAEKANRQDNKQAQGGSVPQPDLAPDEAESFSVEERDLELMPAREELDSSSRMTSSE